MIGWRKSNKRHIAVIDPMFPLSNPRGFRNTEINQYLARTDNIFAYTMHPMKAEGAWFKHGYGVTKDTYKDNLAGYLKKYPQNKKRIRYLNKKHAKNISLAYSFFLAETYTLLPFYERYKIPFIFVLYPGGGFGLDFEGSDAMLQKVCQSEYFRGVIATQPITRDYLIDKKFCARDKITYVYGGFSQLSDETIPEKKYYLHDKSTFDICFVANKYSKAGKDKGYDLFIETAKQISRLTEDVNFHVIGNFDENDVDVTDIPEGRLKFYGVQARDFLKSLYPSMDIYLSPNRTAALFPGNFDGFPLGADTSICGVARFVTNPLDMKTEFIDKVDLVVIKPDSTDIVNKVIYYYKNSDDLYLLAKHGQQKTAHLLNNEYQIQQRLGLFNKYTEVILVHDSDRVQLNKRSA